MSVAGVMPQLTASAPIARVGWASKRVAQVWPPSVLFQTPPSAAPAYTVAPPAASAVTRPALGPKLSRLASGLGPSSAQVPPTAAEVAAGAGPARRAGASRAGCAMKAGWPDGRLR